MLKRILVLWPVLLMAGFLGMVNVTNASEIVAGQHYKILTKEQVTHSSLSTVMNAKNTIEVVEFFNYGCFFCYKLNGFLNEYIAKHADLGVNIIHVPVIFNKNDWDVLAKAYYTAKTMNVLSQVTAKISEELHVKKNKITNEDDLYALLDKIVDIKKFKQVFSSTITQQQVINGVELAKQLKILLIPSLVVKIKHQYYLIMPNLPKGTTILEVLEYLIAINSQ